LFDLNDTLLAGHVAQGSRRAASEDLVRVPVMHSDGQIGELRSQVQRRLTSPLETGFARQQREATWLIAIGAVLLSLIISFVVARSMVAPIKRTMGSVKRLASGDYASPQPELRSDELGELAADITRLATALQANQQARKRWLADISHELRTPVTVLNAELHALKDGVRALDVEQLQSFDQEVMRLQHLIEDLYQLSLSDIGGLRYEFAEVDLSALLAGTVPADPQLLEGLTLNTRIEEHLVVRGDINRLDQLMTNLWRNALTYTDRPGHIQCTAGRIGKEIRIVLEDSAPGVAEQSIDNLFDPLFRTESSRSRKHAGAGLGLAICQNIVLAHVGTITAAASSLGGLRIQVELPAS